MRLPRRAKAACAVLALICALEADASPKPEIGIFIDGVLIDRGLVLGDPENWNVAVTGLRGRSAGGKVTVEPAVAPDDKPALRVKFNDGKAPGHLALYGRAADITRLRDTAALTIEMRQLQRLSGDIQVAMDCGWPCRATIPLQPLINSYPVKEWFTLQIPLKCFDTANFNFTKVNGAFLLLGSGQIELELGDIRLAPVSPEAPSCVQK